jgi:hypothetical protein
MSSDRNAAQDEPPADEMVVRRQARELRTWRESAQRVTRAWNAWLAADRLARGCCYHAYEEALADEERAAAEFQRTLQHANATQQADSSGV